MRSLIFKTIQVNLFIKQKQSYRLEKHLWLPKEKYEGRDKSGAWDEHIYTVIYDI